jgi:tRNA-intron endonuclease
LFTGPDADRVHQQGTFGELKGGKLTLSDIEILFLLDREKISLVDEEGVIWTFPRFVEEVSKTDKQVWLRYLLYSDLRKRGYTVKPGYGPKLEFRVYDRGATVGKDPAKYLVYGLVEGEMIAINDLTSISSSAKLSKKDLILAVIDRQGEITYYDTTEVTL